MYGGRKGKKIGVGDDGSDEGKKGGEGEQEEKGPRGSLRGDVISGSCGAARREPREHKKPEMHFRVPR